MCPESFEECAVCEADIYVDDAREVYRYVDGLGYLCQGCLDDCQHTDMDDGHCLECGLDRTEELSSQDYDMAKDYRKYGGL